MRFTGRIRLGDVQDADLDVTVEVSDTHVRLVSGDESLGSWCLADVVANRLLANEFELELGDETLTFLADDQVNFAYGAVQKMAEGWARYHAMNLVRRKRAVASARRNNDPNRLEAVRQAFVSAREELRKPVVAAPPEPEEETFSAAPDPVEVEPLPAEEEAAAPTGAPRFWEKVEQATAAEATEEEAPAEKMPPEEETSVEHEEAPEPVPMTNFAGRLPRLNALPRRPERETPAPRVAIEEVRAAPLEPAPAEVEPDRPEPEPEPVSRPPVREEPVEEEQVEESGEVDTTEPETGPEPEPVEETNGHREPHPQPAAVGSYRDGHHPSETTGLRASLKSLLSRSKEPHEHSFVEGTTAVGITRKVCLECGHVSIGVSE